MTYVVAQRFFLAGAEVGERDVPVQSDGYDGVRFTPSWIFFCAKCSAEGRNALWAKVIVDHPASYHNVAQRWCFDHGEGHLADPPGLAGWTPLTFQRDWPAAAIAHEFKVALRRAEREIEYESGHSSSLAAC